MLNGDRPKGDARLHDRCDLVCPDLPGAVSAEIGFYQKDDLRSSARGPRHLIPSKVIDLRTKKRGRLNRCSATMPRTYLVFGAIEGKLDVLRVECTKCDRKGRYHVHKLIEKYGRMGNLMKWREMLNADCPKRDARLQDRCDLICPDLSKVL
jgi:hypothetical protein